MTTVVQLTIVAAIVVSSTCYAGKFDHIFTVSPDKDVQCHSPAISNCNTSLYPIADFKIVAWFFHPPFKSCRPLYSAGGKHACAANKDLPRTKEQCENLCGEPCKMGDGSQGICMMEEYCKNHTDKSSAHPRPCGAYNVKCCPGQTGSGGSKPDATNTIGGGDNRAQQSALLQQLQRRRTPPVARP